MSEASPRALTPSVELLSKTLLALFGLGAVAAAFGLFVILERGWHHHQTQTIWNAGAPVHAEVIALESVRRMRVLRFLVRYRENGNEREARVPHEVFRTLSPGSRIEARALDGEVRIDGELEVADRFARAVPALSLGALVLLGLSLGLGRRAWARRAAFRYGDLIPFDVKVFTGFDRALVHFEHEGKAQERQLRIPFVRHPQLERPAGDAVLAVRNGQSFGARMSYFVASEPSPEDRSQRLGAWINDWRRLLPPQAVDLVSQLIHADGSLKRGSLPEAHERLDAALRNPSAALLLRRWLLERAISKVKLSADDRRELQRFQIFREWRKQSVQRTAGAASIVSSVSFALTSNLLLGLPDATTLVATGVLVVLTYPVFALIAHALWS